MALSMDEQAKACNEHWEWWSETNKESLRKAFLRPAAVGRRHGPSAH